MNPVTDIVKELEELGSPLAKLPRVTPFAVPEGYFASVDIRLQSIVTETDPVLELPKTMPFAVPENYFETFPAIIQSLVGKEDEEPILNLPKAMPFDMPQDYFENFAGNISAMVSDSDPKLELPAITPFEVPENYFESFAANIMERVEQPTFGKIEAIDFEVPEGYFEGFAANVIDRIKREEVVEVKQEEKKPTKVISLNSKWKAVRWAAAAVVILGIGFGSYKVANNVGGEPDLTAQQQLAMLDKQFIRSYVQTHIDEFDTELLAENSSLVNTSAEQKMKQLNKTDIEQYLDEADLGDSGIN